METNGIQVDPAQPTPVGQVLILVLNNGQMQIRVDGLDLDLFHRIMANGIIAGSQIIAQRAQKPSIVIAPPGMQVPRLN